MGEIYGSVFGSGPEKRKVEENDKLERKIPLSTRMRSAFII